MKLKYPIILLAATLSVNTCLAASPAGNAIKNWRTNCLSCHGKDGKANTKAGRKSKTKDLTDAAYQATFTDDEAFKSIKEGMKRDGKKLMKPYKDKLTDDEIKDLVSFARKFNKSK